MGEQRAIRESMVSKKVDGIYLRIDNNLSITDDVVYLHNFCADNLKYVHTNALGYNNCKFDSTLEEALMVKSKGINGEISHAC
jgi:hypothetical protein